MKLHDIRHQYLRKEIGPVTATFELAAIGIKREVAAELLALWDADAASEAADERIRELAYREPSLQEQADAELADAYAALGDAQPLLDRERVVVFLDGIDVTDDICVLKRVPELTMSEAAEAALADAQLSTGGTLHSAPVGRSSAYEPSTTGESPPWEPSTTDVDDASSGEWPVPPLYDEPWQPSPTWLGLEADEEVERSDANERLGEAEEVLAALHELLAARCLSAWALTRLGLGLIGNYYAGGGR